MKTIRILKVALLALFIGLLAVGSVSCEKEPASKTEDGNLKNVVYTGDYTRWIYFSLEKNDTVNIQDPENSLEWDVAFHRWDIRTNGGNSGKGQAAAFKTNLTSIDDKLELPAENMWVKDSLILTYMKAPDMSGENNQKVEVAANTLLTGWVSIQMQEIPPIYTLSRNVYLIRSADGEVYRFKFTAFMNDRAEKGYASFSYRSEK